ncbi:hypothetical protein [Halorussus halobius]|uniref:hypothetical protein n=1 Tax=Halorussus halobius TaxID=1710537 RepID=UPI001092D5FA|nr:hypothetical protein [Halorussus halobius]
MPPSRRVVTATTLALLGIAALAYSFVFVQRPLLGAGVAVAFFVVAAFAYEGDADRQTLARATIVVTLVYGVFTLQLPLAVVAACVVYLTAWLTGPDSPLDAPDTQVLPVESAAPDDSEE